MPPLRVLIAADAADAEKLIAALHDGGFDPAWERVESAAGLRAALAAGPWDAVLSAFDLPGFDAHAALDLTRAADPDLPFVVVAGTVGEEAVVELIRAGATDYIPAHGLARLAPAVTRDLQAAERRRAERAVGRQVRQLAAIVSDADHAIVSQTLAGVVTTWNTGAERLYGYTAAEAVGRNVAFLYPAGGEDGLVAARERVGRGESVPAFDAVRVHKSGRRLDVAISRSPVRDEAGQVVGVSGIGQDISERLRAEQALRASEERYRMLLDCVPDPLFVYDRETLAYLGVNDAAVAQYGYTRAEFLGMTIKDIRPPEDVPALLEMLDQTGAAAPSDAGHEQRGVWRHRKKSGEVIEVEITAHAWELGGRPTCIKLAHDITQRKQSEEALRRTTDLLQAVSDGASEAIYVKDRAGRYLFFNPAAARFVGRPVEEVLGRDDTELFDPDDARRLRASDHRVMTGGRSVTTEEVLTAAGTTRTYLGTKSPYRDASGDVVGVIGISRDMTDWKRAEEVLRLRDRAIQAVAQGILITDPNRPDNPAVWASPGYERMTGYAAGEIVGRNCRFLQGKDTDPAAAARLRRAIAAGEGCTVELLNYKKDGTPFWNELSISPVRDDQGRLIHFVGVQVDVTARRTLDEQFRQAQKMEVVGRLAGGVAHDFNNLLTVINGYSELLLVGLPPGDPSREMLEEIHKAGERSAGLTRQLLAFSRKQILDARVLDPNAVVAEAEKMLRRTIGEDVRLTLALAPDAGRVRADAGQLEQVLMNLVVNARDAMPRGGRLTIRIRNATLGAAADPAHPAARPGPHVVLSVTDTGTGMTDEVKAHLFEPFFTTKGVGQGTGLGLATVYGIVQQSGGHLRVESAVGKGTTFEVYLPRAEGGSGAVPARSAVRAAPRGVETILLVEDDDGVRGLTRHVLTGAGYAVLEATDGEAAVGVAAGHAGPIHLLVTDVVMPGIGGREAAERLVAARPGLRVLFLSGYTEDAVVRNGVSREDVDFLQKPFAPAAFAVKVRQVLDRSG